MLRGYCQNLSQDLRNSSTAQNTATEICDDPSHRPNRNRHNNSTLLKHYSAQLTCYRLNFFRCGDSTPSSSPSSILQKVRLCLNWSDVILYTRDHVVSCWLQLFAQKFALVRSWSRVGQTFFNKGHGSVSSQRSASFYNLYFFSML